jgi:hypothetical protein
VSVRLVTMRLSDMVKVHPGQVTKTCALCGEPVGVYPSGQKALRAHPEAEIVCQVCVDPSAANAPAAPIAEILQEMRDSTSVQ